MSVPVLPESAPFSPAQRAWLNGFFAGTFGGKTLPASGAAPPTDPTAILAPNAAGFRSVAEPASRLSAEPAPVEIPADGDLPWRDPILGLDERMALAEGRPFDLRLMAAMAQLDCGSCGYLCRTYAEAIASGEEKSLTKCVPGGKETAKKLKELTANRDVSPAVAVASAPSAPAASQPSPSPVPSAALPDGAARNRTEPLKIAPLTSHQEIVYDRRNPYPARVIEIRALTGEGSEKDVRFVSLDLKGSGLAYEAGDSLGVYPENCPELVEEILEILGATGEEPVISPEGWVVPARIALAKAYVVNECGEDLLNLLSERAVHPEEARRLRALARGEEEFLDGLDLVDLLKAFPSARATARELIPALAPLRPRLYSIASSPKAYPDEVHLTVGVVRYRKNGSARLRKGVASTFLTERMEPGGKVAVFVQPSHGFRPPEDGDRPMIMIGPGTGIAPFRAFLQERHSMGAKGRNWLFFGDRSRASDFLYREELETYLQDGVLSRLDLAFSRDQAEKVYVQRRMMENAGRLWEWLQEGAHVYVCGDAQRMAKDVDAALQRIAAQEGKLSEAEAKAYLARLSQEKRYQRDVY
jgi:sulfite reductase (NADPH) flavoprotein alpha-component